jgi:hypothetical protein
MQEKSDRRDRCIHKGSVLMTPSYRELEKLEQKIRMTTQSVRDLGAENLARP